MVRPKWTCIFPLRVNGLITFTDSDPASLADRHARTLIRFLEPRHHLRRFRSMPLSRLVVVGQRTIKWILPRTEFCRNIITAMCRIGIIKPAVTPLPIVVPRTRTVRHGIVPTRLFANPENRRHDVLLPRETLSRVLQRRIELARCKSQ